MGGSFRVPQAGSEPACPDTERMESLARLAGGLAHEFNNILQTILSSAEGAARVIGPGHPAHAHVRALQEAAARAASLTHRLLAFSRSQILHLEDVDLVALVEGLRETLRSCVGEAVALVVEPGSAPAFARADPAQVRQALTHLAASARRAMPEGGTLRVSVDLATVQATDTRAGPAPGRYIAVRVADTGAGMDETAARRVFEPFVGPRCNRPQLDLAAVHGIAAQHGGGVHVESEPGRGSVFTLLLPAASPPSQAASLGPAGGAGPATVLVVEDDTTVRELAVEVLRGAGYEVLEASDGAEALLQFAEHSGEIGLVLLDSVMPRLGGRETYLALTARWPSVRVIFVSGYNPEPDGAAFVAEQGLEFIQKPYTIAELLGKVREALARP